MKRQMGILTAVLCAGLWMAALSPEGQMFAEAKEQNTEEKENLQVRELASRGNLVYRDGGEKAGIYAADFSLLFGKLSAVSGEVFDPAAYTHMHRWEYRNGDDRTHTKYCALCGAALTGVHKAESEEDYVIVDGGEKYPGKRYRCACGYQWEKEKAHTLTFDMVDETCHRSRCLLDGTEYCLGYEPVEEEHYAFSRTQDSSGTHYIKTCIDCGYQTEEEMEQNEITEQAEIAEEETEQAETAEEETKQPEVTETETIEQDWSESGEPQTPETDESPVLSVSGNDCAGKEGQEKMEGQDETEDKTEELEDGEGEKE